MHGMTACHGQLNGDKELNFKHFADHTILMYTYYYSIKINLCDHITYHNSRFTYMDSGSVY